MTYKSVIKTHKKIFGITIKKEISISGEFHSYDTCEYFAFMYIINNNLCSSVVSILDSREVGTHDEEFKKAFG